MKQQDSIPDKIRKARVLKGLSQENVADMLGISTTAYGDIERGKTELSIKRAQDLSKVLDIPVLWEKRIGCIATNRYFVGRKQTSKIRKPPLGNRTQILEEKFEQQLYLEAYRILQQKQREPIGF
jgi:transcriptional regulator with XRE-family HTH domain